MAKLFSCTGCNNTFASSQSLWNHNQRCLRPKPREFSTNSCRFTGCNTKKRKIFQQNIGGVLVNIVQTSSKEIAQLPLKRSKRKSESTEVTDLPPTVEELYEELMDLLEQLKIGNSLVKTRIIAILKEMKEHGVLSSEECAKSCAKILHNESESEDSSEEDSETGSETEQLTDADSSMNEKNSSQESESDQDEQHSDADEIDEEFNQSIQTVADS